MVAVDYWRRGTIRLATKTCTVSPFWFKVVVRTLTSPWLGRDFDGLTSRTSLSTRSSSPGRTGSGQRNSSKPAPMNAARGLEIALDHQPHRQRSRVPAARDQSPEDRVERGVLIEVEGLRIEFGCESLDPLLVDPHSSRAEGLAHREVFEISLGHCCLLEFVAVLWRPVLAIALVNGRPILWQPCVSTLRCVCGLK
jgi:hypothetical protein